VRGAAEDDGYVMAFIHNLDRGTADLVLLAAQDFAAEPIARPTRTAHGGASRLRNGETR
jgi:carotenoid cleavage dioxygenase-like enzyme